MADETKRVEGIMGPYRGNVLTLPAADADAAINAHWARDPMGPYGDHDPLSEQERAEALTAANDWAELQWANAGNPPPPPEGGATRTRAMGADDPGRYQTRGKK